VEEMLQEQKLKMDKTKAAGDVRGGREGGEKKLQL
jgi:hypothetical protein